MPLLTREEYAGLVARDLVWLEKQASCDERNHIWSVLLRSTMHEYDFEERLEFIRQEVRLLQQALADLKGNGVPK